MSAVADFETRRFQTAAAHYLSGRPAYPAELIARVVQLIGLGEGDRVLDLGCGPAQLAAAFALHVGEVLAMDPEPRMLEVARRATQGLANVQLAEGGSDDLGPGLGRFKAVVIGRAFHWMDRDDALRRLDQLIEPEGAVVLFAEDWPAIPENARMDEYRQLLKTYAASDVTHASRRVKERPHMSVLLASPFHRLQKIGVYVRHSVTLETLTDRALSFSSTSRARLGDKVDEMLAELQRRFAEWESKGPMEEVVAPYALIAWRG